MLTQIKYPSRKKGLILALFFSVLAHAVVLLTVRVAPVVRMAMGFRDIEYVEEDYNRAILIDFSKRLQYPPGYAGFRAPQKAKSLDEVKKEEERRRRLEERRKRERELAAKREAEERAKAEEEAKAKAEAKAEDIAKAEPTPTPTPKPDGYGSFGKINTAPIKDQIQRLYLAKKDGKLVIPNGKFKVGVEGSVNPDGTLSNYRVSIPSGIQEIDDSAMAILAAVSESRALGPLSQLTSLSMVLEIDQKAELTVIGFTSNETDAINIVNLAQAALLVARFKKSGDQAAMIMLNNLKVTRTGTRIQAIISVPKDAAKDTLARTMEK
ncbi:MAG: hypothetical protein JMDDDDMK_00594 [Acidobacteria bacterium]|nr:hypothetical protein [Acidobacteriota bacterium]